MNTALKLEAPWEEVKEKLKEINTDLTDEDLIGDPGQAQPLLDRLAKKLNRTPDEIRGWIESVSYNKGKAS
ncbi:MAG: general stress protein CsbD [Bacteroidota bacterium]